MDTALRRAIRHDRTVATRVFLLDDHEIVRRGLRDPDYVFDIKWDDGSGNVQGSDYGTFTIRVDVTRRA